MLLFFESLAAFDWLIYVDMLNRSSQKEFGCAKSHIHVRVLMGQNDVNEKACDTKSCYFPRIRKDGSFDT